MYNGALRAVSNRETWRFSVTLTDPDTDDEIDLTGAVISIALREQQSRQPTLTGSTTDGHIVIATPATAGAFTVTFPPSEMAAVPAGFYDVGLTILPASGITYQLIAATLPVVDGVVD